MATENGSVFLNPRFLARMLESSVSRLRERLKLRGTSELDEVDVFGQVEKSAAC